MEILTILSSIASIISLLITIFIASKVIKISQQFDVEGIDNVVAGRDANVQR